MSGTTVDDRVVSLEFDNSNFENNVSTTISTLAKLKDSLTFKGVSDGFKDIQKSADNVNMSGIQSDCGNCSV